MTLVYVNAGNDRNGNPRRGWIHYTAHGTIVRFYNEGYDGRQAIPTRYIPTRYRKFADGSPALRITPGQYRDLVRNYS